MRHESGVPKGPHDISQLHSIGSFGPRAVSNVEAPVMHSVDIATHKKEKKVPKGILDIQGRHMIDEVPRLKEPHGFWCGYVSLSTLLTFQGYDHLTPEAVFTHIHGEYNKLTQYEERRPSLSGLARAAVELTLGELRADLWTEEKYQTYAQIKPGITPYDILNGYIIQQTPVIVRFPGHNYVVVGVDTDEGNYYVNSSLSGTRQPKPIDMFDERWSMSEPNYPENASYLMLRLRKNERT